MNNLLYENNNHVLLKGKIKELPTYSHTVMGEGFFEMYVVWFGRGSEQSRGRERTYKIRALARRRVWRRVGIFLRK